MQRTMFETTCTNCGKTASVPFMPTKGKPVYCQECYSKRANKRQLDKQSVDFNEKLAWARRRNGVATDEKRKNKRTLRRFSYAVSK